MTRFCLAFLIATMAPGLAHADIWRCRAADGEVHFTNVPTERKRGLVGVASRSANEMHGDAGRNRRNHRARGTRVANRHRHYDAHIAEAARLYQLPPALIRAVMRTESGLHPRRRVPRRGGLA